MPSKRPSQSARRPSKPRAATNKPKPARRRNAARNKKTLVVAPSPCLSPIACAYVEALAKPETAPLVGIPNGDTIYSRKERVWCRGSASFGATNKNVHILCQPFAALTKDLNVVNVVSDGTALPATMQGTGTQTVNAPFTASQFAATTGVQGRLVSAKLKARYVGTRLGCGGVHYGLQEPTHGGLSSKTEVDFMATTCGEKAPIAPKEPWFEVTYRPVDHHDTSWIDSVTATNAYTYTLKSDTNEVAWSAYPFMGLISKGATAGETIEWEFWANVEYAGPLVTGKTLTPPDLQGWAAAIAAHSKFDEVHAASQTRKAETQNNYISDTIKAYAGNMLELAGPYARSAASAAATSLLNRYLQPRLPPARLRNLLR